MIHDRSNGITVMELLAAVVIIGILVTITGHCVWGLGDDARVVTALNNMKAASAAVRQFHCDFGFVPEEVEPVRNEDGGDEDNENDKRNLHPEYATRFLCLEKDCTNEKIQEYIEASAKDNQILSRILEDGHTGCYGIALCLQHFMRESNNREIIEQLLHDSFYSKGWPGQYIRSNAVFNAAALSSDDYPDDESVYLPVLATPWANDLENEAGKYYQIRISTTLECVEWGASGNCKTWEWKQLNETARIVCLGANGLDDGGTQYPVPDDIGDDLVMFVFGDEPVRSP